MKKIMSAMLSLASMILCSCGNSNVLKLKTDSTMMYESISNYVEFGEQKASVELVRSENGEEQNVMLYVTLKAKSKAEIISPQIEFVIADKNRIPLTNLTFPLGEWNSENVTKLEDLIAEGTGQSTFCLSAKSSIVYPEDWKILKSKGVYVTILQSSLSQYDKSLDNTLRYFCQDMDKYLSVLNDNSVGQFSVYSSAYNKLLQSAKRIENSLPRMNRKQRNEYYESIATLKEAAQKIK